MKISPQWLRDFVDLAVDDRRLADGLTGLGIAVEAILGEGHDTVFEMEIGSNRPDAMNHYGLAREAAALYGARLQPLAGSLEESSGGTRQQRNPAADVATGLSHRVTIDIEDPAGCARYTAQVIRGVKIQSSRGPIQKRLALVDQRSINSAADASNYTLWEMGHPTHTFDLDLLAGGRIIVRRAQAGEALKTLDGIERKLSPDDLIIADEQKPVALAGVMGGFDTMITEKTRNVLIESAWFDPATVRKAARRHGLHTDASHRFERGADFRATAAACRLVTERIWESGGGELDGAAIDRLARELDQAPVLLRISELERILGSKIPVAEVVTILERLGFILVAEPGTPAEFSVRIPSWRLDVAREIDLIEEIARVHGYDRFPSTLPAFSGGVVETALARKRSRVLSVLLALGYNEAISLSFISHQDAETFSSAPVVELENPLSEQAALMRSSLLPGMLDMLAHNLNRGSEHVRLFEMGEIYERCGEGVAEWSRIALGVSRSALDQDLACGGALEKHQAGSELDAFLSLKGDVERLLELFEHGSLSFDQNVQDYFHPGKSARALLDGEAVAEFGELGAEIVADRKLRQPVLVAEIFADRLYERRLRDLCYQALPRFPAVERDFSFLFADEITWDEIQAAVRTLALGEIRTFSPVEIFRGGAVPAGQYSILLRFKFQSLERTLREDEVAGWSEKIIRALEQLGGKQRA
jgi:phenylalanyl-tRNA synthetase beta chain